MALRCGILMIGSLLWDNAGGRSDWRKRRVTDPAIRTRVPIRYGRLSNKRGCTYTMVFAKLNVEQFGEAVVVPCKTALSTAEDLLTEARWLWAAETKAGIPADPAQDVREQVGAQWGRVAFLTRPGCDLFEGLSEAWTREAGGADRELLINEDGSLDVPWPEATTANDLPYDILLATTTRPNTTALSPEAVAEAWNLRGFREYFDENQRAGITTFQDSEIKRLLGAGATPVSCREGPSLQG
jgi:hypothetical protein